MASSKEYLHFILEQLSDLEDISYRSMMGEYILYYRGKIVGGIYDDRLLVTRDSVQCHPHHRERDGTECARTRHNIRVVPGWEVCDPEHPVGQEIFEIGGRIIQSSKTPDAQTQCSP